jgi:A/G-specific adenine glycosylase
VAARAGKRLLDWFRASRRDLPWRGRFPRDPYAVLVSEVMLQQTQVDRVLEAYRRFMRRFPTLEALAGAQVEEVLHAFSGLGYYRRATLLHQAAEAILARGSWPRTAAELAKLPGFGPYTSAAVAAFSFGGKEPPVDGNVARVTARLGAIELPLGSPALLAAGRELARTFHSQTATPEVWEALMELGATICTPASPRCESCPLADGCAALAGGAPTEFPLPRPRRAREGQTWVALWLARDDGRVLLRRVDDGDLLGGMWLPPFEMVSDGTEPSGAARALARDSGFRVPLHPAPSVRHGITHRDILVIPFTGRVGGTRVAEPMPGWRWEEPHTPAVPTSTLLAKLADACAPAGQEE